MDARFQRFSVTVTIKYYYYIDIYKGMYIFVPALSYF
jgi:hypothetical protein